MEYVKLASLYSELEKTSGHLKKTALLSEFFKDTPKDELRTVVTLARGSVAPDYEEFEIGIGKQLAIKAIAQAAGISEAKVHASWKKIGDIGEVAESFCEKKQQQTLVSTKLTVGEVFENLRNLPSQKGKGAVDKKLSLIKQLLVSANSLSAKYIIRTLLGELRIGVGTGIIRDAIALAFDKEKLEIEQAFNTTSDFGLVAELASQNKLSKADIAIGTPVRVMLYQKEESIKDGFERVGKPAILEYKYDGFRVMIHKDGKKVKLFTRRLDNVTARFPEIVDIVLKNVDAKQAIIDSEVVGVDKNTGKFVSFQNISQRIKRKYDIDRMVKDWPVQVNAFDLLYLNGKSLISRPLKERYASLSKIFREKEGRFELAKQLVTDNYLQAEMFYRESLDKGNEGMMMKNLSAEYKPGSRVGFGVKIKPTMEPLDLVIVGGEWGSGKRSGWLSSFVLACKNGDEFLEIGKVGTGIKEKEEEGVSFKELTKLLKPDFLESKGRTVSIKPKVIIEVVYEEIQKSPKYKSGFALRFPRLLRLREDKPLEEVDDVKRIEKLYKQQRGR